MEPGLVTVVATYSKDEPLGILPAVAERLPDVRFAVTGAPRGDLGGWPANLTATGFLSDDDYWRQLARSAAIVVLTTRPATLLSGGYEAMAVGRPLVISDHGVLRDYFADAAVYTGAASGPLSEAVSRALAQRTGAGGSHHRAARRARGRLETCRGTAEGVAGERAVSGVVAILSRDPARSSIGGAGLARLDHVVGYVRDAAELGSIWAGVCGDPERVSMATGERPDGRTASRQSSGAALCAFSGDLLNRARLRRELDLGDAVSPATVALAAYRRWGRGLFDRLEGAFALVVHDAGSGLTLAGVDPCCILPLYLTVAGGDVCIASEAKAFLEHPAFRPRLDREAVGELLCFGQPLGGKPLFAGVRGLPHGAHFEVDAGGRDRGDQALGRASPAAAVAARRRLPRPPRGGVPRARRRSLRRPGGRCCR